MQCSPGAQLTCPDCPCMCHACFGGLSANFPPGRRLFAYGVGIHLISGQPQRRSRDINPEDDHLSFQVRNVVCMTTAVRCQVWVALQMQLCRQTP